MNKNEKVRIDLTDGRGSNPPLKLKKANNTYPSKDKFRLVPKFIPSLEKYFKKVKWNSVEKTLEIKVAETPNFEAFAWFGTINERFAEGQKSSFVDFEQDSLSLYFLDCQEKEVACFKFKNLKLLSHNCLMSRACDSFGLSNESCDHVTHSITIQYVDHKVMPIQKTEAEEEMGLNPQEAIDEEWQTISIPES